MAMTWDQFAATYGDGPLGKLSGTYNSKLYDTMANQIAKAIGFTGKTSVPGTYQWENVNEGGTFMDTSTGKTASPEFLKALEQYQFERTNPLQGQISKDGQNVGTFTAGNKDTGFDKFAEVAVPVGLAAIGGGLAGLFGPVGGGAAAGNTAGGLLGGGLGETVGTLGTVGGEATAFGGLGELSAMAAGAPIETAFGTIGLAAEPLVSAGLLAAPQLESGLGSFMGQELGTSLVPDALTTGSFAPAAPVDALAGFTGGAGLPSLGVSMPVVDFAASAAPAATAAANVAPTADGNGAFLGEGVKSGVPAWDAAAGSNIGLLGQSAAWMKANPLLGRLITSGATTLLSGAGGGSGSGSGGAKAPVTPVTWNSPIQQGLLGQVKQYAPPAITQNRPAGLLAQGYANDGAWRYLGG